MKDFWDGVLAKGDASETAAVSLRPPGLGYYVCEIERQQGGDTLERRAFHFGVLPRTREKTNRFVGVCTHYRNANYPLESMDLLRRYGLVHFRDEISWSAAEKEKGSLLLPEYGKAFLLKAKKTRRTPLLIFDYGCPWYDAGGYPLSQEAVQAYARYAAFLVEETYPLVPHFEVWNEYTGGCGMTGKTGQQTPESYARMLAATYDLVKERVPRATIVGIGGEHSAHHFERIEAMLRAGAARKTDAVSVHSYRYPRSPEESDLLGEIREVGRLCREWEAPARLWITEIGWPTHLGPRGVDEATQARYAVRTLALLQSERAVERVYWYDFRDDGPRREYNEHNFGLVRHQEHGYAPKPAALAVGSFCGLTGGGTPGGLWAEKDCYAVFYEFPLGKTLCVAWCARGRKAVQVQGRLQKVQDLFGNELDAGRGLVLSGDPVYLTGKDLTLALRAP